jgi:hypothetical protein
LKSPILTGRAFLLSFLENLSLSARARPRCKS